MSISSCHIMRDKGFHFLQSRTAVLEGYLSLFEHGLTGEQKSQITAYKLSNSPIYLYMIAHELMDFNVSR